jgi:hypothetical protein
LDFFGFLRFGFVRALQQYKDAKRLPPYITSSIELGKASIFG